MFPPTDQALRLAAYERFEKLFLGQHREPFGVKPGPFQTKRYIVANFCGLISKLCADLLFGEEPDFLNPDEDEKGQEALDRLTGASFHTMNYESELSNSFRGDAVYKVRWGERVPKSGKSEALIEEISPSLYFPEVNPADFRQVTRVALAWKVAADRRFFLRAEVHEPGIVRQELWQLSPGGKIGAQVPLNTVEAFADLVEEEPTKLDHIPVFHVPNFRYGSRFWGMSDYEGIESLFEAANNRLTQMDQILDKHAGPKLSIPDSMVNEDGTIRLTSLELIPLKPGEQPPSYLTWEGQLLAADRQVDRLIELMLILSETSPATLGLDKYGVAESGRALKLRLLRTLAKVNRKRLYYDAALRAALLTAQQFEAVFGKTDYEPAEPTIQWADGLPEDMMEQAQIENLRFAAGNTSVESSIRRLDGPDAVEGELVKIAAEQGQERTLTGAGGPGERQTEPVPPVTPEQVAAGAGR
jgi:hypothetical protein